MNEIVVGVDGSEQGRPALQWAAAVGAAAGVPVRAVQSWMHPRSAMLPIARVPLSAKDMDEQTHEAITTAIVDALGSSSTVKPDVMGARPPVPSSRRSARTACSCSGRGASVASPASCLAR